jgi:DNA polymerase-3 subunit epsilon
MTLSRATQADLFLPWQEPSSPSPETTRTPKSAKSAEARGPRRAIPVPDRHEEEDAAARRLEETGRFKILRSLMPRPVAARAAMVPGAGPRIGVILDTETTGLDPAKDEVIELGMVAFTYDEAGIGDVVGVFSALREPGQPISAEITRITGITAEMVAGHVLDLEAVAAFIAPADLVIAHNAGFDRPFCERLTGGFDVKPWACSVAEVDWSGRGFEGAKLGYLVGQCGWFHQGHRAVDDCHALLEVLDRPGTAGRASPFSELVERSARRRCRIWAEGSPFHTKDLLKARGYRWSDGTNGNLKSWWREVDEADFDAECAFLRTEIYQAPIDPFVQWMTAAERFKR